MELHEVEVLIDNALITDDLKELKELREMLTLKLENDDLTEATKQRVDYLLEEIEQRISPLIKGHLQAIKHSVSESTHQIIHPEEELGIHIREDTRFNY